MDESADPEPQGISGQKILVQILFSSLLMSFAIGDGALFAQRIDPHEAHRSEDREAIDPLRLPLEIDANPEELSEVETREFFQSPQVRQLGLTHAKVFERATNIAKWILSRGDVKQKSKWDHPRTIARGLVVAAIFGSAALMDGASLGQALFVAAVPGFTAAGFQHIDARYTDFLEIDGWNPFRMAKLKASLPPGERPPRASWLQSNAKELTIQVLFAVGVIHLMYSLAGIPNADGTAYDFSNLWIPLKVAAISFGFEGIWYALRAQTVGHFLRSKPENEYGIWEYSKWSAVGISATTSTLYVSGFTPDFSNWKMTATYLLASLTVYMAAFDNYKKAWNQLKSASKFSCSLVLSHVSRFKDR